MRLHLTTKLPVRESVRVVPSRSVSMVLLLLMTSLIIPKVSSWTPIHSMRHTSATSSAKKKKSSVALFSSSMNAFGPFGNFLNEGRQIGRNQTTAFRMTVTKDHSATPTEDDDDLPAGTVRWIQFTPGRQQAKAQELFHFLSQSFLQMIEKTSGSEMWTMNSCPDEYVMDMWFHDGSAVLSLSVEQPATLTIHRLGSQPSTRYLIQESLLLDGILTELQHCVKNENNENTDHGTHHRLLTLLPDNEILDTYRQELSFA